MRRLALLAVVVSLLATATAQTTTSKDHKPAKSAHAGLGQHTLEEYWAAWSTLNPDNAAKFYDKSPGNVYYDIAPLQYKGWEEYKAGVAPLLAAWQSVKATVSDVQVGTAGDMAWTTSIARLDIVNKDGSKDKMDIRHTALWKRKGGRWLIVHEHVSAPLPPPPPTPSTK